MRDATKKRRLIEKLKNKAYRDAFVSDHISIGIPFQIRALRKEREWTQGDLGKAAKMAQTAISRLEGRYGSSTLATLCKLASAFDVALLVRFVTFGRLLEETADLSPKAMGAVSFDVDPAFWPKTENLGSDERVQQRLDADLRPQVVSFEDSRQTQQNRSAAQDSQGPSNQESLKQGGLPNGIAYGWNR